MVTPKPRRFYTLSPDLTTAAGYDFREGAEAAALAFGDGSWVVDTITTTYVPALSRVEGGKLLLQGEGSFDHRHGLTANLAEAARKGIPALVRALIAKGANPNAHTADGGTPLLWAVAGGNIDCVRVLLMAGADPLEPDRDDGTTPISLAERKGRTEMAEMLKP